MLTFTMEVLYSVRGTDWILKYYLDALSASESYTFKSLVVTLWPKSSLINIICKVETSYNDIGLYVASYIAPDIVVPINSSLLTITSYSSVITTQMFQPFSWCHRWVRLYFLPQCIHEFCMVLTTTRILSLNKII